tara:strand:- start:805 stop:1755 length:951 start_codon:yes stop_codon:yes gene_type:complete
MKKIYITVTFFTLGFLILGYFFYKTSKDKWMVRYEIDHTEKFSIIIQNLDNILENNGVKNSTDQDFIDLINTEITRLPSIYMDGYYKDLREIELNFKNLYVETENINILDEQVQDLVKKVNLELISIFKEKMKIYEEMVLFALDQKFEIFIRQLDTMVSLMANQEIEKIKNSNNENKSLDNGQSDRQILILLEFIKKLNLGEKNLNELMLSEEYARMFPYITIQNLIDLKKQYQQQMPENTIEFKNIIKLKKKLENSEFIKLGKKIKLVNQKPKITYTLIMFSIFGFLFSVFYLFVTSKIAKKTIKQKLLFLQNLK